MLKIDNNFLITLGLGDLPDGEKNALLQHIYSTLEMNVGMRLADQMTDAQLDEFEQYINRNDEAGAKQWLETNFPNYRDVVKEELEKLRQEVATAAPHILQASKQASAQAAPQMNMPQQPQTMPGQYQPQQPVQMPSDNAAQGPWSAQSQQPSYPPIPSDDGNFPQAA